jgi:hypothetical protein
LLLFAKFEITLKFQFYFILKKKIEINMNIANYLV